MSLPKDPVILLSYVNTQLRDFYDNLDDLCAAHNIDAKTLTTSLKAIDYEYDTDHNQFV